MHAILTAIQFMCALLGVIYFKKVKKSYWKWFSVYLIFIFLQEVFWTFMANAMRELTEEYYAFIGIPVQYLFFFWLYAFKSLKNKNLFYVFTGVYLLTYFPTELYLGKINFVYSINLTIGTILLSFLVVLEYLKQIRNDDILKFKENKMFYINLGIILFYVGTYPLFAFESELSKDANLGLWNAYYIYFLISNCVMYLLFGASIIWGKHPLK